MKNRFDPRYLFVLAAVLVAVLLAVGCTTRPEASETLVMQGNHSEATVAMVTADTSSEGYHYIEPDLSPDGTRIVFSADWAAVPPSRPPDVLPITRQIAIIPNSEQAGPMLSVYDAGAILVYLRQFRYLIGSDNQVDVFPHDVSQKGEPIWVDDDHIVFWITAPRGARLFRCYVPNSLTSDDYVTPELLWREPTDDDLYPDIPFWEHTAPAISPDGRWLAFSRHGYVDVDSLNTTTGQSLWVMAMPDEGELSTLAFPISSEVAQASGANWSPDGRTIVFQATLDLIGETDYYSKEIFTIDFDTTGLAQNGAPELDNGLSRLTYSEPQAGSPMAVRNESPVFSPDGGRIAFVSDRRVPTLTYVDRNIWWIPSDGSLDPQLAFFTRTDEADPVFTGGPGNELLITSGVGFPTEMLDRLWAEALERIAAAQPYLNEVQVESLADSEREELAFFEGVMSHIYRISDW